ncbi:MAG TPA: alpha/beta hydrolase [Anaerolineales bacterium]|nr:alpha/beta hydrolase [Anaerolineales bacterium]
MPTAAGLHYFLHEGGSTSRPPVVLIHGSGGDHLSWPAEVRRLPDYRVITLDLPGHGKTQGPGCQSIEDYAKKVAEFMDVAGLFRSVFIGHAMGGAIALVLARDHPNLVVGLGLISTGGSLPIPSFIIENAANQSTSLLAIKRLQELSLGPRTSANLREVYFKRLAEIRPSLLLGDLRACERFNMIGSLGAIRNPALVVCGTEDRLTPVRFSEYLANQIPGAALQTVEAAGHLLILEQPARLAKLISVFLATVPYSPGR